MAPESIRFGVAGWSYPDWSGYVYPRGVRDKLRYAAGFVDVLEINSTFYRPPEADLCRSWLRRVADLPDLCFTAKLHQDFTHGAGANPASTARFRDGLAPLAEAGRLLQLLAQFPWSFVDAPESRDRLHFLSQAFAGPPPLALELRHRSWQTPEALAFLAGLGVSVAELDYPLARTSFQPDAGAIGRNAYFRLHGRNTAAWFSAGAGRDETYNYLYASQELDEIVRRALKLAERSDTLMVIANNHYQGKEMVAALELKSRITGHTVEVPPALLKAYPRLEPVASNRPERDLLG